MSVSVQRCRHPERCPDVPLPCPWSCLHMLQGPLCFIQSDVTTTAMSNTRSPVWAEPIEVKLQPTEDQDLVDFRLLVSVGRDSAEHSTAKHFGRKDQCLRAAAWPGERWYRSRDGLSELLVGDCDAGWKAGTDSRVLETCKLIFVAPATIAPARCVWWM